ncbi:MAG TPA: hypothetical protein VMI73_05290 [Trebonia sp.]|nr:hypothetical protein [Trebonia sp.]
MVDLDGQPWWRGLTAQVDEPLGARRGHCHGEPGVGEQDMLAEPADADDRAAGRRGADVRCRHAFS